MNVLTFLMTRKEVKELYASMHESLSDISERYKYEIDNIENRNYLFNDIHRMLNKHKKDCINKIYIKDIIINISDDFMNINIKILTYINVKHEIRIDNVGALL